jgi:glycosyltransferase involved in cell wall biosynthesis
MSEYKKVSIIIPVYNERSTIEQVLAQVKLALTAGLEKEIILVDDCSTDGTTQMLKNLTDRSLKIFFHESNQGKGAALKTGFEQASGDIVVIQDADQEYDPAEIEKVIDPIVHSGAQVVYGSRYLKPSEGLGFWHSFFNQVFTRVGNLLTGQKVTDLMTCYKAFNRAALNSFLSKLESRRFGFEPEVTARVSRAGFQIIEVPISYHPRSHTEGKHMNLKGELESLWSLIKYSILIK